MQQNTHCSGDYTFSEKRPWKKCHVGHKKRKNSFFVKSVYEMEWLHVNNLSHLSATVHQKKFYGAATFMLRYTLARNIVT